jgi:(1->4)-alpha-D-glucan 1-alpha-D-glucosylmutase
MSAQSGVVRSRRFGGSIGTGLALFALCSALLEPRGVFASVSGTPQAAADAHTRVATRPAQPSNARRPRAWITRTAGKLRTGREGRRLFDAVARELEAHPPAMPDATYRMQLHTSGGFAGAAEQVDYLAELGVSDLYVSPILKARPGSTHGYDVAAHDALHPELGTTEQFDALRSKLAGHGMSVVLDTVPNHMGVTPGPENPAWHHLLEYGRASPFARLFDVDWDSRVPELRGKVLLPVLGRPYAEMLRDGAFRVEFDRDQGALALAYDGTRLPLHPRSYARVLRATMARLGPEAAPELGALVAELEQPLPPAAHLAPDAARDRAKYGEVKRRLAAIVRQKPAVGRAIAERLEALHAAPEETDALIAEQAYRLEFWRDGAARVNYRRFFDITDLAAIRMEDPEVFEATHRLIFDLVDAGTVKAIRLDHPDGLWNPVEYSERLQRARFVQLARRQYLARGRGDLAARAAAFERLRPDVEARFDRLAAKQPGARAARPLPTYVEKILSPGERLDDPHVHGTTGYEYANLLGGLLVDRGSEAAMTRVYQDFTGSDQAFGDMVHAAKTEILEKNLASEFGRLSRMLHGLAAADARPGGTPPAEALSAALREVIAAFPVYRTYITEQDAAPSAADRAVIDRAIAAARARKPGPGAAAYDYLHRVLTLQTRARDPQARAFVMRFQQLTGPATAKGLEDTTFYRFNRLLSLNEVGGEPDHFGTTAPAFHRANTERQARWPHAMLASSTHDTKLSEDVRARISVLSEMPARWGQALGSFARATAPIKARGGNRLDRNTEYRFYQAVLGTIPFDAIEHPERDLGEYVGRLAGYMEKATREAKQHTTWTERNEPYDAAVAQFVREALAPNSALRQAMRPLARDVARHGMWNALSQTLLKLTSPGVPDIYQGNETWDFSMVDPDNRRPVDYAARRAMLADVRAGRGQGAAYARGLVEHAEDGRIKLFVTHVALQARRAHPELFGADAAYVPLEARGAHRDNVVAFARRAGDAEIVTVAPRLPTQLAPGGHAPRGGAWADTTIALRPGRYRNLFTGEAVEVRGAGATATLPLAHLAREFPMVLLVREPSAAAGR